MARAFVLRQRAFVAMHVHHATMVQEERHVCISVSNQSSSVLHLHAEAKCKDLLHIGVAEETFDNHRCWQSDHALQPWAPPWRRPRKIR